MAKRSGFAFLSKRYDVKETAVCELSTKTINQLRASFERRLNLNTPIESLLKEAALGTRAAVAAVLTLRAQGYLPPEEMPS